VAKFETVPLAELKTRLPAELLPLVEEFKEKLEKLAADQGGRLVPEKERNVRAPDMGAGIYATSGGSYTSVRVVPGYWTARALRVAHRCPTA
jgi:hypothetical protein